MEIKMQHGNIYTIKVDGGSLVINPKIGDHPGIFVDFLPDGNVFPDGKPVAVVYTKNDKTVYVGDENDNTINEVSVEDEEEG